MTQAQASSKVQNQNSPQWCSFKDKWSTRPFVEHSLTNFFKDTFLKCLTPNPRSVVRIDTKMCRGQEHVDNEICVNSKNYSSTSILATQIIDNNLLPGFIIHIVQSTRYETILP